MATVGTPEGSLPSEPHPRDVDLPDSLTLEVGETWSVRLPGLGSAGYEWSVELSDPGTVSCYIAPLAEDTECEEAGGTRPSATFNVAFLARLVGESSGSCEVRLSLARPWEVTMPPLRGHEIAVTVVHPN